MRQITIQVGWPGGIAWWRPFLDSAPRGLGQLSYLRHIKMQGACREAIWTETKTCSIQDGQGIDYQANPANSSRVLSFRYVNFFKELYIWCLLEVRGARTMRVQCYSETKVVRGPPWPAIAPRWCSPQQSHLLRWLSRSQWTRQITTAVPQSTDFCYFQYSCAQLELCRKDCRLCKNYLSLVVSWGPRLINIGPSTCKKEHDKPPHLHHVPTLANQIGLFCIQAPDMSLKQATNCPIQPIQYRYDTVLASCSNVEMDWTWFTWITPQ